MTEKNSTGVPEQLKKAFKAGTAARTDAKKVSANAKYITIGVIAFIFVIGLITIVIPYLMDESPKGGQQNPQATAPATQRGNQQTGPTRQEQNAKWAQATPAGEIPVGVWSESTKIPIGCSTHYGAGNGTVYKIQYQLSGTGWKDQVVGAENVPADEIRFMATQSGLKSVPFVVKCS